MSAPVYEDEAGPEGKHDWSKPAKHPNYVACSRCGVEVYRSHIGMRLAACPGVMREVSPVGATAAPASAPAEIKAIRIEVYEEASHAEAVAMLEKALELAKRKKLASVAIAFAFPDGAYGSLTPTDGNQIGALIAGTTWIITRLQQLAEVETIEPEGDPS